MQYSPNGRILEKKHITTNNNANPPFLLPSTTGFTNYEYNNNKVLENDDFLSNFAVDRVYNNYEYDANGNMTKTTKYSLPLMQPSFPAILSSRNLYWNDSDQLQAMADYSNSAYYFYNYTGERTWKVVGPKITQTMSGTTIKYNKFNQSTYYLFPQVSVTNSNYTKHIFAGEERICSKIGNGQTNTIPAPTPPTQAEITAKRDNQINLMKKVYPNMCIRTTPISCAILNNANIMEYNLLKSSMNKITTPTTVYEDKQYFYLSDHLGSSSWITDKDGNALQHLSYLPFGEVFANQKASGSNFDAEFKFLGKELDAETGYTKTDNRYYWANAGIFLSVDPLCDERPWITPFNYAQNNPIGRSDKSGLLDDIDPTTSGYKEAQKAASENNAFGNMYKQWEKDPTKLIKFNHTSDGGGSIGYDGKNEAGQDVFNVNWDPNMTEKLGASGVYEESFHLKEAIEGIEMHFAQNKDGSWGCANLDIYDEVRAKKWVVGNVDIEPYFNIDKDNKGYTHYGFIKLLNKPEKIKNALMNGVGQKYPINSKGTNSTMYYTPSHFGGAYKNFSPIAKP
jgi:RHS repeat-associated protein